MFHNIHFVKIVFWNCCSNDNYWVTDVKSSGAYIDKSGHYSFEYNHVQIHALGQHASSTSNWAQYKHVMKLSSSQ